ncbi:MAG: DUF1565 domain-containing protein [Labilithrix sp.]|nr:DUF1565 domain-containing protein [Labilithrix sp.]
MRPLTVVPGSIVGLSLLVLALVPAAGACVGDEPAAAVGGPAIGDGGPLPPGPLPDGGLPPEQLPPGCDGAKDPKDEPCLVSDQVGVFVSAVAGEDARDGTKAVPVRTIARAIERARATGKRRVYVCEGSYPEHVVLDDQSNGLQLYGGFDCASFTYGAAKPRVEPADPGYALAIRGQSEATTVQDFDFASRDAVEAGASSIGVLVDNVKDITFKRVKVFAGMGATAAAQMTAPPSNHPPSGSLNGTGQLGAQMLCVDQTRSRGGNGGTAPGPIGAPGIAVPATSGPGGEGGMDDQNDVCASPNQGKPGANGGAQAGGTSASGYGTLKPSGWEPVTSNPGAAGRPGQGGGGGGYNSDQGVNGSGGGAGSCGGAGGLGGRGGGASIAVALLNAGAQFFDSELSTSAAGDGGRGGVGEAARAGGSAGTGGCAGGTGGRGASGSGGGGGPGGVSAGIVWHLGFGPSWDGSRVDDAASLANVSLGAAGGGGLGGPPGLPAGAVIGLAGEPGSPGAKKAVHKVVD